jgi:hypothetical protein
VDIVNIRVLDLQGAAAFLSLSPRTIRKQLSAVPHFTSPDGGKLLFRSDELLQWLEQFRVKPIDLTEAYKVAEELTSCRRRRRTG